MPLHSQPDDKLASALDLEHTMQPALPSSKLTAEWLRICLGRVHSGELSVSVAISAVASIQNNWQHIDTQNEGKQRTNWPRNDIMV